MFKHPLPVDGVDLRPLPQRVGSRSLRERLRADRPLRLGARDCDCCRVYGPGEGRHARTIAEIDAAADRLTKHLKERQTMHYRNGREAKNGDRIVQIDGNGRIKDVGILYDAQPGNDYCNGQIAPTGFPGTSACLVDCLHADDLAAILAEKGLDKRPPGK